MGKTKQLSRTSKRACQFSETFKRQCGCNFHEETNCRLYRTSGKEIKKSHLNWLVTNNHITKYATYVCAECLKIAESNIENTNREKQESTFSASTKDITDSKTEKEVLNQGTDIHVHDEYDTLLDTFLSALEENKFSLKQLKTLYTALGRRLNLKIYEDSKIKHSIYKDLDNLSQLECKRFVGETPEVLVDFLLAASSLENDLEKIDNKKLNILCILVEQLYFLRNHNFVGPFSFCQSLVKWSVAGSKLIQTIDGTISASGSITTLKKVLKDSTSAPNTCFDVGNVDIFFDNTQRVGKTTRVRESGTTPAGIATNVVFIRTDPSDSNESVQTSKELKPENWLSDNLDVATKHQINEHDRHLNESVFSTFLYHLFDKKLSDVETEIEYDENQNECNDHVSYSITLTEISSDKIICSRCKNVYFKENGKCIFCSYHPLYVEDRKLLYSDVPCNADEQNIDIKLGEIIPVNPNSRDNIKTVINEIEKQSGIGLSREWIRVGCDGVPYKILDSIIRDVVVCEECGKEVDQKITSKEEHVSEFHINLHKEINFRKRYGSVLLVPGAGHTEINLLRALFGFSKELFLEILAEQLGFKSKRAKEFIINCGDHHLSWQIFLIIFHAFTSELIYVYIKSCLRNGLKPSINHFVEWEEKCVKNSNYCFYFDLIFKLYAGLKCFRSGIRQNNSIYLLAGRQAVAPIMFIKKHVIYQHLLLRDMQIRVSAPDDVKEYISNNESFSRSGGCCKCEGGDYITENENRAIKCNLPPGIPTTENWKTASRCVKKMNTIRNQVFQRASIKDPAMDEAQTFNMDFEITMFRRMIRKSRLIENPELENPLRGLDGKELHPELSNFLNVAYENYYGYIEDQSKPLKPVFVTMEDEINFNNVQNWTIGKIQAETKRILDLFPDQDLATILRDQAAKIKGKKDNYIEMYNEVQTSFTSLLSDTTVELDLVENV